MCGVCGCDVDYVCNTGEIKKGRSEMGGLVIYCRCILDEILNFVPFVHVPMYADGFPSSGSNSDNDEPIFSQPFSAACFAAEFTALLFSIL